MNGAAPPGVTATVSPPAEQADRPPRLATAINTLEIDPERTADGTDVLPAGTPLTGAHLTTILDWIMALLDDDAGYAKAWESAGGTHPHLRIQAGDQAAIARAAEIDKEIDAVMTAPLPLEKLGKVETTLDEVIKAFVGDPLNPDFQSPPMRARNKLLSMHQPKELPGLVVPPALVGVEA